MNKECVKMCNIVSSFNISRALCMLFKVFDSSTWVCCQGSPQPWASLITENMMHSPPPQLTSLPGRRANASKSVLFKKDPTENVVSQNYLECGEPSRIHQFLPAKKPNLSSVSAHRNQSRLKLNYQIFFRRQLICSPDLSSSNFTPA